MAHHLEFVFGPLGEETRLACACGRGDDHLRPTSIDRRAAAPDDRAPLTRPRGERLRQRHRAPRPPFRFLQGTAPRHAV